MNTYFHAWPRFYLSRVAATSVIPSRVHVSQQYLAGDQYDLGHAVRDFLCEPPFLEYVKEKFQGLFIQGITYIPQW